MTKKRRKIFKFKAYPHFDLKKDYKPYIQSISNSKWICKHGFYPFIHYTIKSWKYDKVKVKPKARNIYYSAHIDRYIYEYYGNKLNNVYNERLKKDGTNKAVIAYRNCLKKSNIEFAKEVFDFISRTDLSFVFVSDFTDFFDKLDHKYLKLQIEDLLNINRLPDDYYTIYKNITKFTYIELSDILKELNCSKKDLRKFEKLFDTEQFHNVKKKYLHKNENNYGIPQGASISAVFSNIYLLEFDKKVNNFVTSKKGIYRRYCDDIIIVLPLEDTADFDTKQKEYTDTIVSFIKSIPNLEIQPNKTKKYKFDNEKIIGIENTDNLLNYLGFSFDGRIVKIREKTISKFYGKLYHKIKIVNNYSIKYNRNVFRKRFYKLYSHLGSRKTKEWDGNFITYVKRAQKIFDNSKYINNQIKNHWEKINKNLIDVNK